MIEKQPSPPPQQIEKTVTNIRSVCRDFDHLNLALDDLTAQVELEIRNSPLTAYRLGQESPVTP